MSNPLWYKNAAFYQVNVRAFFDALGTGYGNLSGLTKKLDYLKELGVDCLWLMPIYPSPLKDDGYDIADYCNILPQYGTMEDFRNLIHEAHARGLRIIMDLVINHTSDQHPWFQAARSDRGSPYRDYYVWSDDDHLYQDARIIFLDTETSNWTWDSVAGQYYWHRFYASQPDLNYDNPAVQDEMLKVVKFWLDMDVDGFRVDAVPYLFEREGTTCENLPETHAFLKRLRRYIDSNYKERILLCEANQWPEEVREYFGDGDEFHLAFHFPLMPRIFMALRQSNSGPITWALEKTPEIPETTQWCLFLRNHDELTLEMVTEEERQWMWNEYAPDSDMRINLGIRRRLAPLLDNNQALIELANSLLFSLPGSPVLYYGDEIGMGDNIALPDRNGVRTPMQWDPSPNAGFSSATELYSPVIHEAPYSPGFVNVIDQQKKPHSLWQAIHQFIQARKENPVLGLGKFQKIECKNPSVFCYTRTNLDEDLIVINNLSSDIQYLKIPMQEGVGSVGDIFSKEKYPIVDGQLDIMLSSYQYLWLKKAHM
jgi:trehalose synthase